MRKHLTVYVAVIFILALFLVGCKQSSKDINVVNDKVNLTEEDYIKNNSISIELDKLGDYTIPILDSATGNAEVILSGETHGVGINPKLRMYFLKYFYYKAGVRNYLIEWPYSGAVLINQYLKTGDEEIIKKLYSSTKGTFADLKEEFEHFKELYQYNNSLPISEKINVIGIDIEHNFSISIWCLNSLIPEKTVPELIKPIITQLKSMNSNEKYSSEQMIKISSELKNSIIANRKVYEEFLGDNFFDFEFVNDNIMNKVEGGAFEEREVRIYDNFRKIYNHNSEGKYYGQFGRAHILQTNVPSIGHESFGVKLNHEDSPVKGKVISINCMYDKSYSRYLDNTVKSASNYITNKQIDLALKSDLTLIRLNGEGSPFDKELIWPMSSIQVKEGVTTDYCQYFLIIKNAEAGTQYSIVKTE